MTLIIENAGDLLARYDVLFCDVWGVLHNGQTAYIEGCAALRRFRDNGGTVVLVSNAPRTPEVVAKVLATKNVPEDCWDAIVSSGGIARAHATEQGYDRVHHIGPDRDLDVFDGAAFDRVPLDQAQAVFCTGLIDDRNETGDSYRAMLTESAQTGLPLICANPDLVVDVGDLRLPCAGAIAAVYEDMGGPVYWAGKPRTVAYETALQRAIDLRGETIAKPQVMAIGDSVRTDLAGANAYGIDALFIGQGIHNEAVAPDGVMDAQSLDTLLGEHSERATAAMMTLRW